MARRDFTGMISAPADRTPAPKAFAPARLFVSLAGITDRRRAVQVAVRHRTLDNYVPRALRHERRAAKVQILAGTRSCGRQRIHRGKRDRGTLRLFMVAAFGLEEQRKLNLLGRRSQSPIITSR